jgi:hypothetical protein
VVFSAVLVDGLRAIILASFNDGWLS